MPIISINDIGVKEDSAQRLIETVGIDDKYLLSADEINAIVEYCKNNVPTTSLYLGQYLKKLAFETAHPTGVEGNFAWVLDPTESFYIYVIWDVINATWVYDYRTQATIDEIAYLGTLIGNVPHLIATTTGNNTTSDIIVADDLNPPFPAVDLLATYIKKSEIWLYKTIAGATTALRILSTGFRFGVNLNQSLTVSAEAQTAQNTQTFQNKSGVIALTSDILVAGIEIISKRLLAGSIVLGSAGLSIETILDSITIPAGKFSNGLGGLLQLKASITANATLGKAIRLRVSNTNSIAGAALIYDSGNSTNLQFFLDKTLNITNNGMNWQPSTPNDSNGTTIKTGVTLDLTQPIYLLITTSVNATNAGFGVNINSHSLISY